MGLCYSFLVEAKYAADGCIQKETRIESPHTVAGSSPEPKIPMTPCGLDRIVLSSYRISMHGRDRLGEGSNSICWRGTNIVTGEAVAIKTYKDSDTVGKAVTLNKFERQVEVLSELQKPFQPDAAGDLWHDQLSRVSPSDLFMCLLDYSKTPAGPGPDPSDDVLYVITELAQQSLEEFLASGRGKRRPIAKEFVRRMTKSILLVVAGLHAKGFVHLDLKPENLMMFSGFLKLIDVDGCVRIGTKLSILDKSISFSSCYCAPEWARFLLSDTDDACIDAHPGLDAWSTGLTICELVSLQPILKERFDNFAESALNDLSSPDPMSLFMNWLGTTETMPVPKDVEEHDPEFLQLVTDGLLVCSQDKRSSCVQCLSSSYISRIPEQTRQPSDCWPIQHVSHRHPTRSENSSRASLIWDQWRALRESLIHASVAPCEALKLC